MKPLLVSVAVGNLPPSTAACITAVSLAAALAALAATFSAAFDAARVTLARSRANAAASRASTAADAAAAVAEPVDVSRVPPPADSRPAVGEKDASMGITSVTGPGAVFSGEEGVDDADVFPVSPRW